MAFPLKTRSSGDGPIRPYLIKNYALIGRFSLQNHQSICANLAGANDHTLHALGLVVRCSLRSKQRNDVKRSRRFLSNLKNIYSCRCWPGCCVVKCCSHPTLWPCTASERDYPEHDKRCDYARHIFHRVMFCECCRRTLKKCIRRAGLEQAWNCSGCSRPAGGWQRSNHVAASPAGHWYYRCLVVSKWMHVGSPGGTARQ